MILILIYIYNDYFIIKTNEKGCKNYMLKNCKIGKNRFMDFIPYTENVLIEYVSIIKNARKNIQFLTNKFHKYYEKNHNIYEAPVNKYITEIPSIMDWYMHVSRDVTVY